MRRVRNQRDHSNNPGLMFARGNARSFSQVFLPRAVLSLLATVLMWGVASSGTLGKRTTLKTSIEIADLVFVGTVRSVEFRDSLDGGAETLAAPHTFVTYAIEETLHGSANVRTLTLRFAGGYSPATGRVLMFPDWPMFKEGDRDLLLVRGNGSLYCPLVGCGQGRYRLVDSRAYTNAGLAVRLVAGSTLTAGPDGINPDQIAMVVPPAPATSLDELRRELNRNDLTDRARAELQARLQANSAPRTLGIARPRGSQMPTPTMGAISEKSLIAYLRSVSQGAQSSRAQVQNVSADKPFRIAAPAAQPAQRVGRPANPVPLTQEQQRLRQNGGNPVLPPLVGHKQ